MRIHRLLIPAFVAPAMSLAAVGAQAGSSVDSARVVGVEPIFETVRYAVPREQCHTERVPLHRHRASVTGPILGAIIGGAIGNAVGHKKKNKQVGTAVGAVLGGSIGYDIARRNAAYTDAAFSGRMMNTGYRTRQVCEIVDDYTSEERLLGYHVTYRYAGETYTTRMDEHPGDAIRVRVRVTPIG